MMNPETTDAKTTTQIHVDMPMPPTGKKAEKKKNGEEPEPLRFAKLVIRCPCLLCVSLLLLLFGVAYLDSLYFVYTTDGNRMYLVESDIWTQRLDALALAQEHVAAASTDDEAAVPQTQVQAFWTYQLMFKLRDESADDHWILTPQNIKTIVAYEDKIYLSDEWQHQFCAVRENATEHHYNFSCKPSIQSMARDIAVSYGYNYSAMHVADIKQFVLQHTVNNPYYSILFNPDLNQTKQSHIYRSLFHAAMPIATGVDATGAHVSEYVNEEDRYEEQEAIYTDWAQTLWNDITVQPNGDYTDGNLEILALSYAVFVEYFIGLLSEAMFFVIFAVMAVLVYMTLHLRSFILAFAALIQILMSFPLAFFFYRMLFQVTHFDTFSSLIIFVLLGVGADDVFVFTDAWYQSVNFVDTSREDVLLRRMSFAYRRASKAMFITQVTTFFAFMATATSLIMPISAFGIWAATIVACNYMLVVTLFPCIVILHDQYWKRYEHMICCFVCNAIKKRCVEPKSEEREDHYRATERFFGGVFTDFIIRFRVYILVLFVVLYGVCIYFALQLQANKGDEVWFEDDHFMQKVSDSTNAFTAGETDGLFDVSVVWGVDGVNREGTSKWDSEDYGVVKWDKDFDFSSVDGQEFIRDACNELRENHLSFSSETVVCFTDYFEAYLLTQNLSYPVSLSDDAEEQTVLFAELMYNFLHFSEYGEYARNAALVYVAAKDDEYEIKFVSISLLSDLSYDAPYGELLDEFAAWNEWISDMKDKCEEEAESDDATYCAPYHTSWQWADFAVKRAFVSSAIQGVIIAMPLAFVILLISTRNWIISVFAVLDIIGIMLCELALMAVLDWEFGISEAISTVMIIGFSVDYVVHLANAYLEAHTVDGREDRLRFALLTMGISVVSGAITTFSAGFFLIFPVITFFSKMGILMMSTIAFSILFAMFFFTSLLAQFGPQYDTGKLRCCWSKKQQDGIHVHKESIEMK